MNAAFITRSRMCGGSTEIFDHYATLTRVCIFFFFYFVWEMRRMFDWKLCSIIACVACVFVFYECFTGIDLSTMELSSLGAGVLKLERARFWMLSGGSSPVSDSGLSDRFDSVHRWIIPWSLVASDGNGFDRWNSFLVGAVPIWHWTWGLVRLNVIQAQLE